MKMNDLSFSRQNHSFQKTKGFVTFHIDVLLVASGPPTPWHRRLPRGWVAVVQIHLHRTYTAISFGVLRALIRAGAPDSARAGASVVVIDEPAVSRSRRQG